MAKQPPSQLEGSFARLGERSDYPWEPLPSPGLFNKVLFSDPVPGFAIEAARVEQGAEFPQHYHTRMQPPRETAARSPAETSDSFASSGACASRRPSRGRARVACKQGSLST
jgi:hypothetical protein